MLRARAKVRDPDYMYVTFSSLLEHRRNFTHQQSEVTNYLCISARSLSTLLSVLEGEAERPAPEYIIFIILKDITTT